MRKNAFKISLFALMATLVFAIAACFYVPTTVRVPFEELQSGAFYNGSLVFNPSDPSYSHLGKGTLIALQDITYGPGDDGYYEAIDKKYGYMYIREIDTEGITYDYLIYDKSGNILEKSDNVFMPLVFGNASFSASTLPGTGTSNQLTGIAYHTNFQASNSKLENSYLLSFQHDTYEVSENTDETYRRVVFRVMQSSQLPDQQFPRGIVAISASATKSLVTNSDFYTRVSQPDEATETEITLLKTDNLPEFSQGDFIFDAKYGILRKVESVEDDGENIHLTTTEGKIEDALGTLILDIEGDVADLAARYGTPSGDIGLQSVRVNLIHKEWDETLFGNEQVSATLKNSFDLDFKISLHMEVTSTKFVSHGNLVFPINLASILEIYGNAGFDCEDDFKIFEPGFHFNISGIPVHVSVPTYLYYELGASLANMDFRFGPELSIDVGFGYDVGVKMKWDGIHKWSSAWGIFSHSTHMVNEIDYEGSPQITGDIGFKLYPGVTIACILRPQMKTPVYLEGSLKDDKLKLDLVSKGYMEMELDLKFYSHTFEFGKVFEHRKNLYEHDLK